MNTPDDDIRNPKRMDVQTDLPRSDPLSWDEYFMALAQLSAMRSKDPHRQVGAVIVDRDHRIQSVGYNGFPRGCKDAFSWARTSEDGDVLHTKYPFVVHAEVNAVLNKRTVSLEGSTMYVTVFPCNECAKVVVQAGIRTIVVPECVIDPVPGQEERYRFEATRLLFEQANVRVVRWKRTLDVKIKRT